MIGDAIAQPFFGNEPPALDQLEQQLGVVEDGPAATQLRILVLQGVVAVRVGGEDALEGTYRNGRNVLLGERGP